VKLVGGLSEMALVHLLRRADVLVYASNGLGEPAMPTAIMEAMSCGLPVISTTIGGTGEMINHGREGLLVRPGDENALSAAIVRLAKNLELRNAMGQAARQRAVQLYDCRKTAGKLLDNIRAAQKREQNRLAKLSAAQDEESADSVKQDN
jgi:colanic acid/amylovoran biosynthesis glycosyltransferase